MSTSSSTYHRPPNDSTLSAAPHMTRDWSKPVSKPSTIANLTKSIFNIAELKDGNLAIGSESADITILNRQGKTIRVLKGHTKQVNRILQLRDGSLASSGHDGNIKLWNQNGTCMFSVKAYDTGVTDLIELKDGTLASCGRDGYYSDEYKSIIKLWNQSTCILSEEASGGYFLSVRELQNGTLACRGGESAGNKISLWRREMGFSQSLRWIKSLIGHTHTISTLVPLRDGTLASGAGDRTIKIWDSSGNCIRTLDTKESVDHLIELSDGTLAAAYGKTIMMWDQNWNCIQTLKGHSSWVSCLTELKDGTLASGSADKSVKLWEGSLPTSAFATVAPSVTQAPSVTHPNPLEFQKELGATQSLLQRYIDSPGSDRDYVAGVQNWLSGIAEHFRKYPQDPTQGATITELQRLQQELRPYIQEPVRSTSSTKSTAIPPHLTDSALIKSISADNEQDRAVNILRAKESFAGRSFRVTRSKKDIMISYSDQVTLKRIGAHLSSTFDSSIVEDCDIDSGALTVTARTSMCAADLESILNKWLCSL